VGGFLNSPIMQGSDSGIPPEILRRRNGLMQAIMQIPEDQEGGAPADFGGPVYSNPNRIQPSDDTDSGIPPTQLPKGVTFQKQNWVWGTPTDTSNPPRADLTGPGMQTIAAQDRIEDDKTRHPQGDQPQTLAEKMNAGDYSSLAMGGQTQPADDHLARMQQEYEQLGQPKKGPSLLSRIAGGAIGAVLPGYGAARLRQQGQQSQQTASLREKLLSEIESERRMQEQEQLGTQRMSLQEQMQRDRMAEQERLQGERLQPEHIDTDQGPIQYNRQTKQWEPIMLGGQKVGPKAQPKPDTPEQQFFDSPEEQGKTLKQKLSDYAAATQKPERSGAADARDERSYQATLNRVDKLRTPIEQRLERISRLEDTLNQNNPQADSLIAPELLTVMAGGQGSGLRMNEAEIARIVGGANNWQRIKSQVMAWQADPSQPFVFQPAQRQQIRDLFTTIKQRVTQKAQAIEEESQTLADSNDPKAHRQIYNRLQKRLLDIDTGTGGGQSLKEQVTGQQGPTATGPNGHKIKVVGGRWVDAATGKPIQ